MSFRNRILLTSIVLVWVPLIVLALLIRAEMTDRLTSEYTRRVETLVRVIEEDLDERTRRVHLGLADLKRELREDNRFRLLVGAGPAAERAYVLDYASRAMPLLGLSMLQIQDAAGRILSSGHFRNEYDRSEPELPGLLTSVRGGVLIRARHPEGPFLVLAARDSLTLAGERLDLVGGVEVGPDFLRRLARGDRVAVSLLTPGGVFSSDPELEGTLLAGAAGGGGRWQDAFPSPRYLARTMDMPFLESEGGRPRLVPARLVVSHPLAELRAILRRLDVWLGLVVLASVAGTLAVAAWASSRVSRPLAELAERTRAIDLERFDTDFSSPRGDEVGVLSRFLDTMLTRLRAGARNLREAERRAAMGELARQVNHDIKNGLTPIRNVLRHLSRVAREEPGELPGVFRERERVLDSSVAYLEGLSASYARLSPRTERQACDLNRVARELASARGREPGVGFDLQLAEPLPPVLADPVALRRILENLITNACDSLRDGSGTITIRTEPVRDEEGGEGVRLTVSDTGEGIPAEQQSRIFDDFYTTREKGAGLGLSIVRRLVGDFGGEIRVDSRVGEGTSFMIRLPAIHPAPGPGPGPSAT